MPPSMADQRCAPPSNESNNFTAKDVREFQRRNANALPSRSRRWPRNTVPYEFDDEIKRNPQQRGQIITAMKEWEEKTCLKFEPYSVRLAQELGHYQRLRMVANLQGCWSKVGMMPDPGPSGNPQIISLQRDGCMHV